MNRYLRAVAGVLVLAVIVSAEYGFYIPKAFYKLDENGYKTPLTYIDNLPPSFHRVRRSAQLGGVNFGFPFQVPQFPNIPAGTQGNFQGVSITSTGGGLHNRFDEDGPVVQSTFTSFSNNNGHVTQTTHFVDKDGKVTTHRQESGNKPQNDQQQQNNNNNNQKSNDNQQQQGSNSSQSQKKN
ncbi:probable basic-leucine zipper transcription factor P [Uranotaenia lowii]|uniref:probable basic-leucine zipper transcription factor P n=1 Tax=Uranotaenia lowii TaxID=190385 RepID=UPI0024799707|nr:probable basic-leucine zipper transcription factor P [Uranotaenia lowii]